MSRLDAPQTKINVNVTCSFFFIIIINSSVDYLLDESVLVLDKIWTFYMKKNTQNE